MLFNVNAVGKVHLTVVRGAGCNFKTVTEIEEKNDLVAAGMNLIKVGVVGDTDTGGTYYIPGHIRATEQEAVDTNTISHTHSCTNSTDITGNYPFTGTPNRTWHTHADQYGVAYTNTDNWANVDVNWGYQQASDGSNQDQNFELGNWANTTWTAIAQFTHTFADYGQTSVLVNDKYRIDWKIELTGIEAQRNFAGIQGLVLGASVGTTAAVQGQWNNDTSSSFSQRQAGTRTHTTLGEINSKFPGIDNAAGLKNWDENLGYAYLASSAWATSGTSDLFSQDKLFASSGWTESNLPDSNSRVNCKFTINVT